MKKPIIKVLSSIICLVLILALSSCAGAPADNASNVTVEEKSDSANTVYTIKFGDGKTDDYSFTLENSDANPLIVEKIEAALAATSDDINSGIESIQIDQTTGNLIITYKNGTVDDLGLVRGSNGLSSYEVACNNGYTGTEEQWINLISIQSSASSEFVSISEYITYPNTLYDMSTEINKAISENPNKTLYFPDGVYYIASPISTSGNPDNAVSFKLSNFAIIKAIGGSYDWDTKCSSAGGNDATVAEAMIRLGATNPLNTTVENEAKFFFEGGIIDGSDIANGMSVDGGRQTRIENVNIKNTPVGLHVKKHPEAYSPDADVRNVNILGTNTAGSIGVICRGHDNTFSNMRIDDVQIGFKVTGGGNVLRDIHTLETSTAIYAGSIGFLEVFTGDGGGTSNLFDFCYSDQFETAFRISGYHSVYTNCWGWWYKNMGDYFAMFTVEDGQNFKGIISNPRAQHNDGGTGGVFFNVGTSGGTGKIIAPIFSTSSFNSSDNNYNSYLQTTGIVWD